MYCTVVQVVSLKEWSLEISFKFFKTQVFLSPFSKQFNFNAKKVLFNSLKLLKDTALLL